jgi:hypothetical protein
MWGAVLHDRELLRPEADEGDVRAITAATTPNIVFYAGPIALAFVLPTAAAFGYLVIAVVAVARVKGEAEPAPETAAPA